MPTYFLLSGSIVILTAYAALALGLLHGFFALAFPFLMVVTGFLLNVVVSLQNAVVYHAQLLPYATQATGYIGAWQFIILLGLLATLALWLRWRRFSVACAFLSFCLILGGWWLTQVNAFSTQSATVVYHVYRNQLMDLHSGQQGVAITGAGLVPSKEDFAAENYRGAQRYRLSARWPLDSSGQQFWPKSAAYAPPLLEAFGQRWLLLHRLPSRHGSLPTRPVDYILVSNNFPPSPLLTYLQNCELEGLPIPTLVVDASNANYRTEAWRTLRDSTSWPIHITAFDGALIVKTQN